MGTTGNTAPITTEEHTMNRVIVYSKPDCVQCNATYRALTKKGVEYDVVDVTDDEGALAHIIALGYQQVPVVETPTDHWSGYQPERLWALANA